VSDQTPSPAVGTVGERSGVSYASASAEDLFPLVYPELRRLAGDYLRRERPGHTLQPTALVHEAYLKLAEQKRARWKSRTHFIAVGARIMKQLLIDHARKRGAAKRGAGWHKITLAETLGAFGDPTIDVEQLLSLNKALELLTSFDRRAADVVVLRLFGGLSAEEAAEALGVSRRTVSNDWRHALAWLRKELNGEADG
jgi:RNA polymerase sigma factor (TIGR02999 family)